MPNVTRTPILSSTDVGNPRPWFVLDADPDELAVTIAEANGLREWSRRGVAAGRLPGAAVTAQKQAALRRRHALALSTEARGPDEEPPPDRPKLADEVHALAVNVAGDLAFVPLSRQDPEYYAHLGFYDPLTDTWDLLEFHDDTEAP